MFHGWENYFYMIGSASAGLIGLLFVVVTLTSGSDQARAMRGAALYLTPTAVHFAAVLSVSAIALAPGLDAATTAALLGLVTAAGTARSAYSCVGIAALRRRPDAPHGSDVWMYGALPALLYLGLAAASVGVLVGAPWAMRALAGSALLLLLAAIRNAWDLVTWMAPRRREGS